MAYANHALEYRKNAVNGASPVQLVIMLYDGALRFMEQAKAAISAGERESKNTNLQRAQRIIFELMATLNMAQGGEIAKNLLALYTYVIEELVTSNFEDNPEAVDRAMRTMSELRESWVEVDKVTRVPSQEIPLAA